MRRDLRDGLFELVVHLVLGLLGFLTRNNGRTNDSFEHQLVSKLLAKIGILRNSFRENVQGSIDRFLYGINASLQGRFWRRWPCGTQAWTPA